MIIIAIYLWKHKLHSNPFTGTAAFANDVVGISVQRIGSENYDTVQYDNEVFNVQFKNWRIASLVYHTESETK